MPKYKVRFTQSCIAVADIAITARNEKAAWTKAEEMLDGEVVNLDFVPMDGSFDIETVQLVDGEKEERTGSD